MNQLKVLLTAFSPAEQASEEWDVYHYLKRKGISDITALYWGGDEVKQKIPADVKAIEIPSAKEYNSELLNGYDLIFRHATTQPVPLQRVEAEITSMTAEFFKECPAPVIGVTGTKGKGTTCELINRLLTNSGFTVHMVGNILKPTLNELPKIKPDHIVVFELSSFKLWDLKQSPKVAVILMIEPDHLDVHMDLNDYLQAKSNIVRWQEPEDLTIYLAENDMAAKVAEVGLGKKLAVPSKDTAEITDGMLVIGGQTICQASEFGLLGEHNQGNIIAALTAAWQFVQDSDAAAKAIKEFKGLPHRLQFIARKNGVDFVDDSISTTPTSAIAALRSFDGPKAIILGGSDKGANYQVLANELASSNGVRAVLIGQTAGKIQAELDKAGFKDYDRVSGGMMEIVRTAAGLLESKGTVLLSPACASFDMFKDYQDRADKFKLAVESL
ncbi:MAG TPA: UDP-N-acetylmuramoyl-L-alanine--D-glutamate ligase [Candidatus Saccharimonadales bacterium]